MFKLELEVVHIEMARIKHSIYIFLFLSLFLFLISLLLKVCNYSPKFSVVCACAGFIMSVCMFFHIYSFTERYKELRKALMRFYERKERYIKSFDCDMTSNFYNICGTNNSYEIMDVRWGYYVISIVYIVLYLWYFIYLIRWKIFIKIIYLSSILPKTTASTSYWRTSPSSTVPARRNK